VGDLEHAWYVGFGRLRELVYFVMINIMSRWHTLASCLELLRDWMSCLPMHAKLFGSIDVVLMSKSSVLR
jgi:hypothetical protein